VGPNWLEVFSTLLRDQLDFTHSLTSDAAEDEDLDHCNETADTKLVDDVELSKPSVTEDLVNCDH